MFNRLIPFPVFKQLKFFLNINELNFIYLLYFCPLIVINI